MKKLIYSLIIILLVSTIASADDTVWNCFIRIEGKTGIEGDQGYTKSGDIKLISMIEPSEADERSYAIIKITGLLKDDRGVWTSHYYDPNDNPVANAEGMIPEQKILAERQWKLDIKAMGLKVGYDKEMKPLTRDEFVKFLIKKDTTDINSYKYEQYSYIEKEITAVNVKLAADPMDIGSQLYKVKMEAKKLEISTSMTASPKPTETPK